MREFTGVLTDPVYESKKLSRTDQFFSQFIRDERDLPFVHLSLQLFSTVIPTGLFLYTSVLSGWTWLALAVANLLVVAIYFLGPYTLMLHLTCHRRFLKDEYSYLNPIIPCIIGPFFGQTPYSYFAHHVGMHHPENNLPTDGSSTMHYQRDEWTHWAHYFGSFLWTGVTSLRAYLTKHNKNTLLRNQAQGELVSYTVLGALSLLHFKATLFVFLLPWFIIRFGMMAGNWAQHAFIDAASPDNNYRNSITCINAYYNRVCFNDGYHIAHHLKPTQHWTEMPAELLANRAKYVENDAIIFEELDFFIIWFFLMLKRYDWLAHYYVNMGHKYKSDEEVVAMLKSRTARIVPG
mmetsp:Transcript_26816/g.59337  ORF Transcript_26816/g.59337 Transcript_26816/m.59337 type:complete len:349 (+) Transcript_26816:100-1146(+)